MDLLDVVKKKHRKSKAGAKANKKKKVSDKDKQNNPKAFNVANIGRTKRIQQRNLDRMQKKELVPLMNRSEEVDSPPPVIIVMGPKGVGKSTLIRSLVKMFTKQNVLDTKGPISVLAGKKKRFTFFECPQDIYSMTDLSKIADLVIIMIDASYGFEMETFEFLNQLQLHGFPKVIGVLTHLDGFISKNKLLQNTKKAIKHRFWTEIYKGAKMFDMSGVVNNKYLKHEVKRLSLLLMRTKFRPLVWRNTHPYLLIDRIDDITSSQKLQEDPLTNRDIMCFGYIRGTHLKLSTKVHLIGAGDYDITSINVIEDPCPLASSIDITKRSLKAKDTLLYAPMANVGRVSTDKDGMYIDIKHIHYTKRENLQLGDSNTQGDVDNEEDDGYNEDTPIGMLRKMQDVKQGVDQLMNSAELSLFAGDKAVTSKDLQPSDNEEEDEEDEEDEEEEYEEDEDYDEDEDTIGDEYDNQEEEEDDEDDEEDGQVRWKDNMESKATSSFYRRMADANQDWMTKVYGKNWSQQNISSENRSYEQDDDNEDDDNEDDQEEFFTLKSSSYSKSKSYQQVNNMDSSRISFQQIIPRDNKLLSFDEKVNELVQEMKQQLNIHLRVSKEGQNGIQEAEDEEDEEDVSHEDEEDEEVYGDFEDLEAGISYKAFKGKANDEDEDEEDDVGDEDDEIDSEEENDNLDEELRRLNALKKANKKEVFNEQFDELKLNTTNKTKRGKQMTEEEYEEEQVLDMAKKLQEEQRQRNQQEFGNEDENIRLTHEGYRQGLYVRILLSNIPKEFCDNFHPQLPIILGGLQHHEMSMGIIKARVKRHRWHKRILKSNNPLIFSIGWRRFQSIPIYAIEDEFIDRSRFLKYTPEHMHCIVYFYGPLIPPNTSLLAYEQANSITNLTNSFRISLTGSVLESQCTPKVMKKLKLVGYPYKIYKNTAFIRNMFTSSLEVAKLEGSKIKTISGIRGSIKKALKKGEEGSFRASFEDKILMSDIITCRLWVNVEIKKFYNPVLSLLTSDPQAWKGMRTLAQIRKEQQIPLVINKDSIYKPIERKTREFSKLYISSKLQESLPFASKPKLLTSKNTNNYMSKRAIIIEKQDSQSRALLQIMSTIRNEKESKRKVANLKRLNEKKKTLAKLQDKFVDVEKDNKKRKFREEGLKSRKKNKM